MCGSVTVWTTIANRHDLLAARIKASHFDFHLHDTYTIGVMRAGTAKFVIRDKRYLAHPGDVFIVHPYEVHDANTADSNIEYDVLYPSTALMADAMGVSVGPGDVPRFGPTVLRKCGRTEDLLTAIEDYIDADPETRTKTRLENAFTGVFRHRGAPERFDPAPENQIAAVHYACELMQAFLKEPLDLEEIAERVGFSRFHFTRVFTKATGMSPGAFLRQVRLAEARNLILEGRRLVDVALKVGFSDQAHLTREFKRVYGITPGQFSRSVSNDSALGAAAPTDNHRDHRAPL